MNVVWAFFKGLLFGVVLGTVIMWFFGLFGGPHPRDLAGFLSSFGKIHGKAVFSIGLFCALVRSTYEFEYYTEIGRAWSLFRVFYRDFKGRDLDD